MWLEVKWCRDP